MMDGGNVFMMAIDLSEKISIVTGGTRGIGRGIVESLAEAGSHVVVVSRHLEQARATAEEIIQKNGIKALALQADISELSDVKAMVGKTVKAFDRIDILVNNAGTAIRASAFEITEEIWDTVVATDLKGTFFCAQEAALSMRQQGGGRIINIGSVHSHTAMKLYAHYGACKAGVAQLTRVLALEWAEYGILVNCVAPGSVPTEINKEWLAKPENLQSNLNRIPVNRLGTPQDIAAAVVFLCSEYASYITGQTIYVDGGWTI